MTQSAPLTSYCGANVLRKAPSCLLSFFLLGSTLNAQVTRDRLLHAAQEPQNWLTYGGAYSSQRYSKLDQITSANVRNLELKWVFQSRSLDVFESNPLVVDGMMYTTQGQDVVALDAATGHILWTYRYFADDSKRCCGKFTRGLAILNETLYFAAVDAHLIALDAKTGTVKWNTTVANARSGYSMTLAPLVVHDKVIVGTAGGEYGIRGLIAGYDANTGKETWRFYTVAGPGDPGRDTWGGDSWMHGGGSVWVTGTWDPETNLTYWGVGNPGP